MKILIADDDADDRILALTALKEIEPSLEVDFAHDGHELMKKLQETVNGNQILPDLVLLDLNMPKKDGRAALKEIKNDPALRDLKIIIFSTSTAQPDKDFAMSTGASSYIVKPSTYGKLMEVFKGISQLLVA
jgi:CheY-like chemotaxis protein